MLSCRVFLLEIYRISRDRAWITGNPEVISSPVGLVPTNALVLTDLATFRVVGNADVFAELHTQLDKSNGASRIKSK
jgi:hypothetical protein